ncbi:hypothetical protein QTP86_000694 [Hemibagrus guttatus]|nr:hypothetical protein QTP86_000694 [Hemibagrus guttatus]
MIMMVKDVVMLWMASLLVASAEISVNASKKMLTNIPATYGVNITRLILHHNRIVMSNSDIQALRTYSNLTELDLSYNFIAQLPDGAFSALGSLETLRPNVTCATPANLAGERIVEVLRKLPTQLTPTTRNTVTATKTAYPSSTVTASTKTFTTVQGPRYQESSALSSHNISSKGTLTEAEQNAKSGITNSWKFLTGVIVIILCTSMFLVCAVKSPTWYKMLFDYRHQRLHESEDPSIFNTGRYSNFSLDTEQTETSAHELDLSGLPEDEDGFIEDGYIQPDDYKEHTDVGGVQTEGPR